jgi:hypothetical protein
LKGVPQMVKLKNLHAVLIAVEIATLAIATYLFLKFERQETKEV